MSYLPRRSLAILIALVWCLSTATAWSEEEAISYNRDVRPILSDKCFACHGFDAASREADLRLDTREGAIADLGGYRAIVPGDPDASEAMVRMLESDESMRMPPPHAHKEITPAELETLKRWIAEGAVYEEHWSYRPLTRPSVPEVEAAGGAEKVHPVDAFIRRQLKAKGLTPSPQADKGTLVRRLYLDLVGVPPRPHEVKAFVEDSSPDAWERLVDRLLDDPRFGERMAVMWLDLVRYADTIGYHSDNYMEVSAYRDYVIDSFNRNKAFDRFTIEQLAGDLLPDATRETRVASGYNMLLQTTEEGGAQPKEYVAIYAADRVRNVSEVWLGSTLGCAQCHDHKYDPFSLRDFSTMSAFFADIQEQPIGPRASKMAIPTPSQERRMERLLEQIAELRKIDPASQLGKQVAEGQRKWEETARDQLVGGHYVWTAPKLLRYEANDGIGLERLADSAVLSSGPKPYSAVYEVELEAAGTIRSLRLETLTDPSFQRAEWLSREYGGFVLTDIEVVVDGKEVKIAGAKADYQQGGFPIEFAYDDNEKTGWAVAGRPAMDRLSARFDFAEPLELGDTPKTLRVVLRHESIYSQHHIGKFRIGVSDREDAPLDAPDALPAEVAEALRIAEEARSDEQQEQLAAYYQTIAPELEETRGEVRKLFARYNNIQSRLQTTLVAQALPTPRVTRVLARGNWQDETGDIVEPAVPEFLPQNLPTDRRLTRLDLAEWIVDDANPLPARTLTNRMWKMLHGRGISVNLGDLGGQGEPPTHPDLLDWLAVELRESGWDLKHLIRTMVTSDTYRQSSYASKELRERDPGNRWLARQGRWRVEAEFVRDTALDIAGLLKTDRIGGMSVKPYQPAGYWRNLNFPPREWENSKGDDLYRRSLYTFWCRTFLHPSMVAFDAPSREECTAERSRSNVPQQALVLLNDPIFVEAARSFAERIVQHEGTPGERIEWAFHQAVSRAPHPEERAILQQLYDDQLARYSAAPDDAQKLIAVGESPIDEGLAPVELAAWTQVGRAILSAYETTSRF